MSWLMIRGNEWNVPVEKLDMGSVSFWGGGVWVCTGSEFKSFAYGVGRSPREGTRGGHRNGRLNI